MRRRPLRRRDGRAIGQRAAALVEQFDLDADPPISTASVWGALFWERAVRDGSDAGLGFFIEDFSGPDFRIIPGPSPALIRVHRDRPRMRASYDAASPSTSGSASPPASCLFVVQGHGGRSARHPATAVGAEQPVMFFVLSILTVLISSKGRWQCDGPLHRRESAKTHQCPLVSLWFIRYQHWTYTATLEGGQSA